MRLARRSGVLAKKLVPILRIPAGGEQDPDALLTESGDELTTEADETLIAEGYE